VVATFAGMLANSPQAFSQETGGMKTVAVVAVSDYEQLIADIDKLGELGGQVKAGQQMEGMLNFFTQNKGLAGLDKTKPWGAVVQTDGFQFMPVVCVPVTDLSALLELATMFQMKTTEVGDGITEIEIPNQSIYVKEGTGWAFLAQSAEMLAATPDNPQAMFAQLTADYDVGVRLMVQNVPEMYRSIGVEQMRAGMEQGMEQMEGESDEDFASRRKGAEAQIEQLAQMINELEELTLGANYDGAQGNLILDGISKPLAGTDSAEAAAIYASAKTAFAGCLDDNAAIRFNMSVQSPPELMAKYADQTKAQMDSMRKQLMNAIENEADLPNDAARETVKSAAGDVMDSLEATIMSGTFDVAGHVNVSTTEVSILSGGFVKEPAKLESALKKVAAMMEGQPDFPGVQWNAATHAGMTIHTMTIPVPDWEDEVQKILGGEMDIALAIGNDSFYFAAGTDNMAKLKAAIDASGQSQSVKPFNMSLSLLPFIQTGKALDKTNNPILADLNEALLTAEGMDEIHMTVEGMDGQIRGRLELESGVLKAIGAGVQAARMQGAGAGF